MPQSTLKNRTIFCKDNLDILQGIDSNSIDLIYLDPPFNKKKIFTAPIGSSAEGASFKDWFREEDVKDEWVQTIKEDNEKLHNFLTGIKNIDGKQSYNYCYLCYMVIRLIEMQRILKDTGSIYLHCDPTMSHYLKIVLDCIFGEKNFRNEIVWYYKRWTNSQNNFQKMYDNIIFYSKTDKYYFKTQKQAYSEKTIHRKISVDGTTNLESKRDINKGISMHNVWEMPYLHSQSKERTGYPTQKPLALLDRIIQASSNEGDIVLDPFCGCATTCIASEKLNRKWIGIDVSIKAYDLVRKRLEKEVYPDLFNDKIITFSTDSPIRTDKNFDALPKKWIYIISNENYKDEFKVGVASDWKTRLNSYQTSDPNRAYEIEYKIHTPFFREIEKHIHEKFENRHEWVRASLQDIIEEIKNYEKKIS